MKRIIKAIGSAISKIFGPLVNVGDTATQESGRDSFIGSAQNITYNFYGPDSKESARLQEKVGKDQEKKIKRSSKANIDAEISIAFGQYIGIVRTIFSVKTRVHLEFSVFNNHDSPRAVRGLLLKINNEPVHFKQFFKIIEEGSRVPDPSVRLPHMINGRGGTTYRVEFENIRQELIQSGTNRGELIVIMNDDKLAKKKFTFEVNEAMEETLSKVQAMAFQKMQPQVFDAMIKS